MSLNGNLFTNAYGNRLNYDYTKYLFTVIGRYIHLYSIYIIFCGARYASATHCWLFFNNNNNNTASRLFDGNYWAIYELKDLSYNKNYQIP